MNEIFSDLTIVIPVRIDSKQRLENLRVCVEELRRLDGIRILVLEAGVRPETEGVKGIRRVFIEDKEKVFYRTRYINMLVKLADTPFVGVWDADVIIPAGQLTEGLTYLREGLADMVFPEDGRFVNLQEQEREEFIRTREFPPVRKYWFRHAYGGAFLVDKIKYVEAGGENEGFYGWGPEDVERVKRWEILGYTVKWMKGTGWHLDHPRLENSGYGNVEWQRRNIQALLDTCRRSPAELRRECSCRVVTLREEKRKGSKQEEELLFWQREIRHYISWYTGVLQEWYQTAAPGEEERVKATELKDAAILTWFRLHQQPKYLKMLEVTPDVFRGMRLLDVGAGPMPSAVCFEGCELYCLEPLLPAYLEAGFPLHYYSGVRYICAAAEKIPVEDHFFDAIISVNAIDHVDDIEAVACELKRIARPGCRFRMCVHYHEPTVCEPVAWTDEKFRTLFSWVEGLYKRTPHLPPFSEPVGRGEENVIWTNF